MINAKELTDQAVLEIENSIAVGAATIPAEVAADLIETIRAARVRREKYKVKFRVYAGAEALAVLDYPEDLSPGYYTTELVAVRTDRHLDRRCKCGSRSEDHEGPNGLGRNKDATVACDEFRPAMPLSLERLTASAVGEVFTDTQRLNFLEVAARASKWQGWTCVAVPPGSGFRLYSAEGPEASPTIRFAIDRAMRDADQRPFEDLIPAPGDEGRRAIAERIKPLLGVTDASLARLIDRIADQVIFQMRAWYLCNVAIEYAEARGIAKDASIESAMRAAAVNELAEVVRVIKETAERERLSPESASHALTRVLTEVSARIADLQPDYFADPPPETGLNSDSGAP